MCVNCEKKMLNIYRQGKTFTDQFYVDEDYNVPDTKADIREIIESDAVMEELYPDHRAACFSSFICCR